MQIHILKPDCGLVMVEGGQIDLSDWCCVSAYTASHFVPINDIQMLKLAFKSLE